MKRWQKALVALAACVWVFFALVADSYSAKTILIPPNWKNGFTMTGPLLIPDGSAAAPSIAFSGDADGSGTGIYRSAADTIAISSNGNAKFFCNTTLCVLFANDFDTRANEIASTTGPTEIGGNCALGGVGDVCTGADLYLTGDLRMAAQEPVTGGGGIAADGGFVPDLTSQTLDTMGFVTGSTSGILLLIEAADRNFDFAHTKPDNPTLFGHSADQDTTEWWSLTHDGAGGGSGNGDAVLGSGAGGLKLALAQPSIIVGAEKDLTDETAVAFVRVDVPTEGHAHGTVWYSIYATDGTDMQSMQGMLTFSAVNKAGTVTCDVQQGFATPAAGTESKALSAGTISVTAFTCAEVAADTMDISIEVDTSLTPTTFEIEWSAKTAQDYNVTSL